VLHDEATDDYEVFVMELDGSGKRNLTQDPAVDWAYTAHGDRIFLVSDRDDEKRKYHLYEMGPDGGETRQISEFRVRDSWLGTRNDGSELVIASSKDGTADLYLIDRDGTELRRLTEDEIVDNDPTFSADGTRVVWRSSRSGLDELWLMDLESGEARQLTQFPEDDPARDEHAYHAGPPRWVPQSETVSFCSKRNGNTSIFTIRSDGSGLEQITGDDGDECWHAWSPDGRYMVYDRAGEHRNYDIYLREVETGTTTRLTDDPTYEQGPLFVSVVD
jgi:TolB protein